MIMTKLWVLVTTAIVCLAAVGFVGYSLRNTHEAPDESLPVDSPQEPLRIVSLAPNLTEILFALGLGERIVAVSSCSNYPPEAAEKLNVGTFWQPDTEAIIAARPDLVVGLWFEQHRAVIDTLRRLGYRVLTLRIERIGQLFVGIEEIGRAARCEKAADQMINTMSRQIESLKARSSSANKVRVLWVVQTQPLRVAGENTFVSEVIKLAGGQNVMGATIQQYPQIDTEVLLGCAPEVIIQSAMAPESIDAQHRAAEVWWGRRPGLPAVKNGRIYVVDPDTILRLGPRLPQGIETVARCLHPAEPNQVNQPQRNGAR
jgi:iron complex transport system substrate-binding protein